MTAPARQPHIFHPPAWLKRIAGPFASRPRLMAAIGFGAVVGLGLAFIPNDLRPSTRFLIAWDAGVLCFIVSMLMVMAASDDCDMRVRAAVQDEGQHFILGLVLIAAVISIGGIAKELSLAKADHATVKVFRVGLAFLTVIASWFLVQLIFALHYAHEYYSPHPERPDDITKGLEFPDDDTPDYWDFLYFAVVLGVASQTADVSFKTKMLRRVGTVHGVVAFTFNTVVLALTINLLAGLF
jgi:uncharacterized membrane protein